MRSATFGWLAGLLAGALLFSSCGRLSPEVAERQPTTPTSPSASTTTSTIAALTTRGSGESTGSSVGSTSGSSDPAPGEELWQAPLPKDPGELAADLTTTERAIRNPALHDSSVRGWGQRLQRLYRVLSANAEWGDEVVSAVAEDVRPDVALNWIARQNLSALVGSSAPSSTLPAWRIQAPKPASELRSYYQEAEDQTGVPWEILAAVNFVETRMGRIVGLSTAGAVGPMQFLPSTWAECCEGDPADDHDAIIGAAVYLTHRGAPSDIDRALLGYNNSQNYVNAVRSYAAVMERDGAAYDGYHAFEVYFRSSEGLVRMPTGYRQTSPIGVKDWLENNPDSLID